MATQDASPVATVQVSISGGAADGSHAGIAGLGGTYFNRRSTTAHLFSAFFFLKMDILDNHPLHR